jgi:ABC-2 type transport system ATP-binding protein
VDPVSRREFWRIIAGLHRGGKTVLVATPYMDEAERCTEIAFMDGGRIVRRGTPSEVKALVPGRLYELAVRDQRAALAVLQAMPGVRSAHLFGDVVRVLCAADGPTEELLTERLYAAGLPPETVRPARVDMEAVFAYLAESGSVEAPL